MERTTSAAARRIRGQLVVLSTRMAMLRPARFCWYRRFVSVVISNSYPLLRQSDQIALLTVDQPHS